MHPNTRTILHLWADVSALEAGIRLAPDHDNYSPGAQDFHCIDHGVSPSPKGDLHA